LSAVIRTAKKRHVTSCLNQQPNVLETLIRRATIKTLKAAHGLALCSSWLAGGVPEHRALRASTMLLKRS